MPCEESKHHGGRALLCVLFQKKPADSHSFVGPPGPSCHWSYQMACRLGAELGTIWGNQRADVGRQGLRVLLGIAWAIHRWIWLSRWVLPTQWTCAQDSQIMSDWAQLSSKGNISKSHFNMFIAWTDGRISYSATNFCATCHEG